MFNLELAIADYDRNKKAVRIARNNRECKSRETRRYIGKPGGTGAGKNLAIPLMPYMRKSVIG